ncbi:M1 family metallopeptidase [Luteibaculum oceani]|uniref:M1 family metallopeptidase n=1 Tax=Luteibaculum oceani TaxID=1294296 RepID=A0A5C6USH7_9FLAO|nr:M1 family metallopeptidase [Luteibaculum oceani]TXC76197.1 M1 family metallopeptidase [Luteibaculum oceani]
MKAFLPLFLLLSSTLFAQEPKDPTYNQYRSWWDVVHYDLTVEAFPSDSSISGINVITLDAGSKVGMQTLQIDLQEPMQITEVKANEKIVLPKRVDDHYLINFEAKPGLNHLELKFNGKPHVPKIAPWESGIVFTKDKEGYDWIASACQDKGASIWWPCKDHPLDEADSVTVSIICKKPYTGVANGRLTTVEDLPDNKRKFTWKVTNPINNYGVNLSVGNYTYFKEDLKGEKGTLDATYYVLPRDIEKAKIQFMDAQRTIEALEYWFGAYPFYEDGYKLVQVPYLGMEHQSCVTYGNQFKNGYLGRDLSGSGWGLKFDFIIIHESGHEWFANSITHKNRADMWIHEGFTSYSESLFLEYFFGDSAGAEYVIGTRSKIANDKPIIGDYNANEPGSGDMYFKGANIIHTLRTMVNDTEKWRSILRELNATFYHQTVSSYQVEQFLAEKTGLDLEGFFNTYLRTTKIPELHYGFKKNKVFLSFKNVEKGFQIPLKLTVNGEIHEITVGTKKAKLKLEKAVESLTPNPNYYLVYRKQYL